MRQHLLSWQWSIYPVGHRDRRNLAIHLATALVFQVGCVLLVSGLWNWRAAIAGGAAMLFALIAQGRGHKLEETAPVPFEGPIDLASRFFVEQWVTFPRYVLTGGWGRAWRSPGPSR